MRENLDDEVTSSHRDKRPKSDTSEGSGDSWLRRWRSKSSSPIRSTSEDFCKQAPPIFESFVNVLFDHAVGEQILGPTKNPCPSFFTSVARGSVWTKANWGNYYRFKPEEHSSPLPSVRRLVAIGDLHGDIEKTRKVLEIAKLLGSGDRWAGKDAVLVQVGDIFDRGGGELRILYLLEKLRRGALRKGGDVHILHGNHETENVLGRYRFATKDSFLEFDKWYRWYKTYQRLKLMVDGCSPIVDWEKGLPTLEDLGTEHVEFLGANLLSPVCQGILGRLTAMRPGGPVTRRFLAPCPVMLVFGRSLFVHGGMRSGHLPSWAASVVHHNTDVTEWLKGKSGHTAPDIVTYGEGDYNAVTWNRDYGKEDGLNLPCYDLQLTLSKVGVTGTPLDGRRMLIGHTIQRKRLINAACRGSVMRIDVGMSKGCLDNPPQALEIRDDKHFVVLEEGGERLLSLEEPTIEDLNKLFPRRQNDDDDDDEDDDDDDDEDDDDDDSAEPAESSDSFKTALAPPSTSVPSPEDLSLGDPGGGSGEYEASLGEPDEAASREALREKHKAFREKRITRRTERT